MKCDSFGGAAARELLHFCFIFLNLLLVFILFFSKLAACFYFVFQIRLSLLLYFSSET
ncbi:hypothetical protein MmiHf6_10110 [Methanimicrococcus hongohii]|uniref:Uncharacterized protein n=1 Tax=Methanimicrococcus hongohii TaxID=3028295 RepID=A0AA96V0U3_9EURY|nr:hypothetical protein MmiHf6_10110 [Methanimicrococcus sp. Hf6]